MVQALRLVGAGIAVAVALGACGGDDNNGTTDITPAQAAVVGGAAVHQLGGLANGLSHFNTPGVGGLASGFFAPAAPGGRGSSPPSAVSTHSSDGVWGRFPGWLTAHRMKTTGPIPTGTGSRTTTS